MTEVKLVAFYFRLCIIWNLIASIMCFTKETYIKKILRLFGIENAKEFDTPITKKNIFVNADLRY